MIAVLKQGGFAGLYPIFTVRQTEPMKPVASGLSPRGDLFKRRKREIDEHDEAKPNSPDT
jgi:hypothetical protein